MFTNNYYVALHEAHISDNSLTTSKVVDGTTRYTFSDGTRKMSRYSSSGLNASYSPISYLRPGSTGSIFSKAVTENPVLTEVNGTKYNGYYYGYGVIFGSGNTPPTEDDCTLSGDAVSGFVYSQAYNCEVSDDGKSSQWQTSFTITNNNAEPITIGELGVFCEVYMQSYSTQIDHKSIMLDRTVLETPITIEPGGVGQVTATWRMEALPVAES